MFWQLLANGLVTGSVIAIAAVGVSLIYGILRLVNFAYGDFMAFGALVTYSFNGPVGLGIVVSTLLGMVATAILSLVLDAALWRPLRARRAGFMSFFLASIGLALVLRQVLLLAYGPQPREYDVTPDHQPILGQVSDRVYVAAGFSGHGFMIAPAVARILADAILDGRRDETLGVLDVARFAENRSVPEPQLV